MSLRLGWVTKDPVSKINILREERRGGGGFSENERYWVETVRSDEVRHTQCGMDGHQLENSIRSACL